MTTKEQLEFALEHRCNCLISIDNPETIGEIAYLVRFNRINYFNNYDGSDKFIENMIILNLTLGKLVWVHIKENYKRFDAAVGDKFLLSIKE